MTDNPYDAAPGYIQHGWTPIAIPYRKKMPPPTGMTGYDGVRPDAAQQAEWAKTRHNIAIRLPDYILGIDVDDYVKGGRVKHGGATLLEMEANLGMLPPTWRTTARKGVSGIRYYRVPSGRTWADVLGDDVEIVHYGHRYAVVEPSIHPEGMEYETSDPDGLPCDGLPDVDEIPPLPQAWVDFLDRGALSDRVEREEVSYEEVEAWLADLEPGECHRVDHRVQAAILEMGASRHDTVRGHVGALIQMGVAGHKGVREGLQTIETAFKEEVGTSRAKSGEWERMFPNALAYARAVTIERSAIGCCEGVVEEGIVDEFMEDLVFASTPVLRHIKQAARSRMVSPLAVLGSVLARVACSQPPSVTLPATVGSASPLNLSVGIVGPSGSGKSAANAVASEVLYGPFSDPFRVDPVYYEGGPGSGEGILETFLELDTTPGIPPGTKRLKAQPNTLLYIDEIARLGSVSNRQGSTITAILREAWSGQELKTDNATTDRVRHIKRMRYSMSVIAGIQPALADVLLKDEDAGTPQRWLWLPATDPLAPNEVPEWPGTLQWEPQPFGTRLEMGVCQKAKAEIVEDRRAALRGEKAGHGLLGRLKAAGALALLHGETTISEKWWSVAEVLLQISDGVQEMCREKTSEKSSRATKTKIRVEVEARHEAQADVEERVRERLVKALETRKRALGPGRYTLRELNLRTRDNVGAEKIREFLVEAVDLGLIKSIEQGEYRGRPVWYVTF